LKEKLVQKLIFALPLLTSVLGSFFGMKRKRKKKKEKELGKLVVEMLAELDLWFWMI
jgi:hypothetical protein